MAWMVYGANGYTGELVARLAVQRGEQPLLAGRSAQKIAPLAAELGLPHRIADLTDPAGLRAALSDVDLVVHCAGPFSATARPVVDACLATGTHYVDITGEIDVFEQVFARAGEAEQAGVVLLPGAGFDVVPTDGIAALLAKALPTATHLDLAFLVGGGISPGTLKSSVEGMASGGRVRVDGQLRPDPVGSRRLVAEFPSRPRSVASIPWGDVSTAYRSTGIPNIVTYTALPSAAGTAQGLLAPLLRLPVSQAVAKRVISLLPGPSQQARQSSRSEVWGEVRDAEGKRASLTLSGPNGYSLTADAVLRAVGHLLAGEVAPGAHTPSTAFGADFVRELDGVRVGELVTG
ncbi:saccharopine dehydrogenase (NAD+, L-lysine-forming) [Kutzneria viridogrisea]|uniref:Saccharopine dehydrogenase (NAD+, L-lysine-forming) n=1 Tax=Kutzneria viridogrisea TaxID=47990 RepID=A0ABR6BKB3_9PSEU|nr:saccharopine dehydrogenase (NAD+, L-lysine-forming) [Kutzneria viridogrisea]